MSSHHPSCDRLYEAALSLGGQFVERRDRDLVPIALRLMARGIPVEPPTSALADPVVSALDGVSVPLPWPRHLDEVFRDTQASSSAQRHWVDRPFRRKYWAASLTLANARSTDADAFRCGRDTSVSLGAAAVGIAKLRAETAAFTCRDAKLGDAHARQRTLGTERRSAPRVALLSDRPARTIPD
jgi:hypothetical protein